jgi:hypothetical protein
MQVLSCNYAMPTQDLVASSHVVPGKQNTLGSEPLSGHDGMFWVNPEVA